MPVWRQVVQRLAQLLLFVGEADQLIERQVALELVHLHQLIQAFAQGGLAFQQLLLIARPHQEKLAGGLEPGDARHGLGFVQQLRRRTDPLADIVFSVQLPQARRAEQQHPHQQHRTGHAFEQGRA